MKLGFLELLFLLQMQHAAASVNYEQKFWAKKSINASIFDDPAIQSVEMAAYSGIQCAAAASTLKWPNLMYFNSGICRLAAVDLFICKHVVNQGSPPVNGKWLYKGGTRQFFIIEQQQKFIDSGFPNFLHQNM